MFRCSVFFLGCLAAAGVLATGCASAGKSEAGGRKARISLRRHGEDARDKRVAEAHAHYSSAIIREIDQDLEGALQEYYLAAMADPEDETLALETSRKFLQNKQPEKALQVLARAAAAPGASGEIEARLGLVYAQLGKHEQAVSAARLAIRRSPELLAGYQNLVLSLVQLKQPEEAMKAVEAGARQPKGDAEFLIGLAEISISLGLQVPSLKEEANTRAKVLLNRAEKMEIAAPALRLKLAEALNLAGDTSKAAELYLDLIKRFPNMPLLRERLRSKLTDIYLRGSDHKGAIEQLKGIVKDDPTNAQAYYYLASLLFDEKNFAEAIDSFEKAIVLNPELELAYYDLASSQLAENKAGDALKTLGKAREKFRVNFVMEFLLGMAFSQQKAYTEALQHYTSAEVIAQATEPKRLNDFFYFQLGAASERKGDFAQAEKAFRKSIELAPNSAEALNYLGYMWAEKGTNLVEARAMIEKALKQAPTNSAYLDSLGWVLYKMNEPKAALEYILKASALSPEPDATLLEHLGDIYAALNEKQKAREAWEKSLTLEPNEQIRKKLEKAEEKQDSGEH